MTRFSEINIKTFQQIAGPMCYNTARRRFQTVKDCLNIDRVRVLHLAVYFDVPESEIIELLLPPKKAKSA